MTTHDSAASALKLLEEVHEVLASSNRSGDLGPTVRYQLALTSDCAQVHATLAVANQLERIANVLTATREPSEFEVGQGITPQPIILESLSRLHDLGDQIESAIIRGMNR